MGYSVGAVLLGLIATHTNYAVMYRISIVFLVAFAAIYGYHLIRNKQGNLEKNEYSEKLA
jgi:hypothetical protein